MKGKLIRFPSERRQQAIEQETASAVQVSMSNTTANGGASIVAGPVTVMGSTGGPKWWRRVPPVNRANWDDRKMWMKLGAAPTTRAKRHRVVSIDFADTVVHTDKGSETQRAVVVRAACGRKDVLSPLFDDPFSGGDCAACRKRGWR